MFIVTDPITGHLEHIQINCNQTKHRTYFLKIFPYRACSDLSKNVCFKKNEGGEGGEKFTKVEKLGSTKIAKMCSKTGRFSFSRFIH